MGLGTGGASCILESKRAKLSLLSLPGTGGTCGIVKGSEIEPCAREGLLPALLIAGSLRILDKVGIEAFASMLSFLGGKLLGTSGGCSSEVS